MAERFSGENTEVPCKSEQSSSTAALLSAALDEQVDPSEANRAEHYCIR